MDLGCVCAYPFPLKINKLSKGYVFRAYPLEIMEALKKINKQEVESRILEIRGVQVMIDTDVSEMYDYEPSALNRQVNKKIDRFPSEKFIFELTQEERKELIEKYERFSKMRFSKTGKTRAFTEYGVLMLATILESNIAALTTVKIIEVFIEMRERLNGKISDSKTNEVRINDLTQRIRDLENENKGLQDLKNWKEFSDLRFDAIFDEIKNLKDKMVTEEVKSNKIGF